MTDHPLEPVGAAFDPEQITALLDGLYRAIRDPDVPLEYSGLLMECAQVLRRTRNANKVIIK